MSNFYFIQILCFSHYMDEWFIEFGMLEDLGSLVIYKDNTGSDYEVYEGLNQFLEYVGEDYIEITKLD